MANLRQVSIVAGRPVAGTGDVSTIDALLDAIDASPTGSGAADTAPRVTPANGYGEYEDVGASATDQALGATGATGDYLSHVSIAPQTLVPGVVTIKDGTTVIGGLSFVGGAGSVSNLVPFTVDVGLYSKNGAWKITTGANVKATGHGEFT